MSLAVHVAIAATALTPLIAVTLLAHHTTTQRNRYVDDHIQGGRGQ